MKLRIISDIHMERIPWEYLHMGEDIVIIAGDLFSGYGEERIVQFFNSLNGIPTYLVAGNHEFYNTSITEQWQRLRTFERKYPNLKWLENEFVDFETFRLCGCTLWTDFLLNGEGLQKKTMDTAWNDIGDFTHIMDRGTYLHPRTLLHWHSESVYFLEQQVKNSPLPLLVVTHFLPSRELIDVKHEADPLNPYFCSNLTYLFGPKIPLWIHGHSHSVIDKVIDGTRHIRNPRGYESEKLTWNPNLIIEV